ncbi:6096_t:CDS:2, partial [Gigaspora rosea]
LLIFDKKYAPLFRLRRLALVELPFQKNLSSTELSIIEDGEEQSNGGESEFDYLIPTSNTPRLSINIKK